MFISVSRVGEHVKTLTISRRGLGEGPLERLLGPFSSIRILDFLSTFREFDYSIADIARNTGLSRKTVERELPRLLEYDVVESSRTVGRAQMYRMKQNSPVASKLNELIAEIARIDSGKLIAEEEHLLKAESPPNSRKIIVP